MKQPAQRSRAAAPLFLDIRDLGRRDQTGERRQHRKQARQVVRVPRQEATDIDRIEVPREAIDHTIERLERNGLLLVAAPLKHYARAAVMVDKALHERAL